MVTPEQRGSVLESQWESLALELADVLIYPCRLADVTDIDLMDAAARKIGMNAGRFPAVRSSSGACGDVAMPEVVDPTRVPATTGTP